MPILDIHRTGVHFLEMNKGASRPVLMIHGMFSNLALYYFKIAPLIAQDFHVVLYDLKSHGLSDRVAKGYDLHSMTDDLLALMDALKLESVHLVGYSYGGLIAMEMAMRFPEKVRKLAIIEGPDPSDQETLDIIDIYSKEFLVNYINNYTDTTRIRMGKRQLDRNHRMYEFLFNETSIRNDMHYAKNFFMDQRIESMGHDTLLIYGKNSNCVSAGKKLLSRIPNSHLSFIDGDHNIPIQEPLLIASALKGFFYRTDLT
ncbi:alpha/beta fold hydrolase [Flavitalea flava]